MSSTAFSNRNRDSYIKRYNDYTSLIYRPASVVIVENINPHSRSNEAEAEVEDFKNSSRIDDDISDSKLTNHQDLNFNGIFNGDFYNFDRNNDEEDDDDGSSITSILEAFTDTLATPPSMLWECEKRQSTTSDDGFSRIWNLRPVVQDSEYHTEQSQLDTNSFSHPIYFSSSLVKKTEGQRSLKRHSSISQLSPRSCSCSMIEACTASPLKTPSHRANKSWPNRMSYSTSLPLLSHHNSNKRTLDKISTKMGPKSRNSDLSTCATLVSNSPIRSTFEWNPSYVGEKCSILNKVDDYRDQTQKYGLIAQSSPRICAESEKSSWESDDDDDDDDTDTINNDGTFVNLGLGWPRFGLIQIHDIKRKLRMGTPNSAHENDSIKQTNGKWHEAIRKSSERKKKVAYALRGFLRLKVPQIE